VQIIAHTKENVVKKQGLTYDEMEAEHEEVISYHNFSSALASNVVWMITFSIAFHIDLVLPGLN